MISQKSGASSPDLSTGERDEVKKSLNKVIVQMSLENLDSKISPGVTETPSYVSKDFSLKRSHVKLGEDSSSAGQSEDLSNMLSE